MTHPVPSTKILGTHVMNWDSENMGNIVDIMIDKPTGELLYLVLSYPGDYGRRYPNKRFAIPFETIAMRDMGRHGIEYIIDCDQKFLEKAPGFDCDDPPDFADQRFIKELKDYYENIKVDIRV